MPCYAYEVNQRKINLNCVFGQKCFNLRNSERHEELEEVVDDLDPAEDGEPGEKTHGASN